MRDIDNFAIARSVDQFLFLPFLSQLKPKRVSFEIKFV